MEELANQRCFFVVIWNRSEQAEENGSSSRHWSLEAIDEKKVNNDQRQKERLLQRKARYHD